MRMWKSPFAHIDPITKLTGAAISSSLLKQHLSTKQSELLSEALSWTILPAIHHYWGSSRARSGSRATLPGPVEQTPASGASLWAVALAVSSASVYQAEYGIIAFFPALSPLLAAVQTYIEQGGIQTGVRSASDQDRVWVTAFIAVLCIIALTSWDLRASALSGIPVVGLLVVYLGLTRPPESGKRASHRRPIATGHIIRPLSFRVVVTQLVVLGVEIAVFGPPKTTVVGTISLGVAKSLMWYFLLQTCQAEHCSWSVTAAIGTFSIVASRNPFTLTSNIQALSHLIASLFALGQIISLLPDKAKSKSALWICIVVYLVPYLINNYSIHVANTSVIQSPTHSIGLLIQDAKANFQALLERQSNSYTAACEEYRRRYGMEPPPGFENWYNFAKAHQSPVIDDFDIIYDRISPFWSISGTEVTEAIDRLQHTPNSDVWVCTFSAEEARTNCNHPHRSVDRNIQGFLNTVLGDLRGLLPDVKFLVNHLDEPRVLLPSTSERSGSLHMTSYSKRPVWDTLVNSCPSQGSKKADRPKVQTFGLPFVTDRRSTIDLCSHPEYRVSHGLLISPTSFPLVEGLVPILSTGSLSTMGDILYPSPAYLEPEFEYVQAKDISWDSKHNNLYWAGSTTGGFAVNDDWQSFHRQRFVKLTQNLGNGPHVYLREGKGVVSLVKSSFLNSRLFDVAFTRIFQCETRYCRDQQALFRTKSWADKDEALHSRLVFDIDGNGISGRYYKLLASKSAPLKQTLLREWHDDRLMPWVHYIPVSQSMEELPEIVMYFTSEAGQKRAREIAEEGREWFSKAFRKEDLTIYMYRVLLELARLQDPKRSARRA
ncbi:F-actin-capping protein subunit beta [Aspergillus pseudoviridinutans]|uniref:F-actin-capping protein subunit beta n=1 Tax=Aspergillus pseudoviridinutans TaxID=1517512 RepID=A0A9P3BBR0_9EURO|nr:F-actin-capping protein subunit beta [Aspergillus pseudoviridinutans]GIJ84801.1 F-actin-capping protein subunit beta [Aspergillus pseudoviridinutans]